MATVTLNDRQLKLIQTALDLYSRIGILQLEEILSHPTVDEMIEDKFTPKKQLEVGDRTMRGEIVEIGKKFIRTKGHWGSGEEIRTWKDIDKIKLSPDWDEVHRTRAQIKALLGNVKSIIANDPLYNGSGASLGIHNPQVDDSCRVAYDMIQIIRHEFWKANPNRSAITVDSSVLIWTAEPAIRVELDEQKVVKTKTKSPKSV
jgi:hypothetical protein